MLVLLHSTYTEQLFSTECRSLSNEWRQSYLHSTTSASKHLRAPNINHKAQIYRKWNIFLTYSCICSTNIYIIFIIKFYPDAFSIACWHTTASTSAEGNWNDSIHISQHNRNTDTYRAKYSLSLTVTCFYERIHDYLIFHTWKKSGGRKINKYW